MAAPKIGVAVTKSKNNTATKILSSDPRKLREFDVETHKQLVETIFSVVKNNYTL